MSRLTFLAFLLLSLTTFACADTGHATRRAELNRFLDSGEITDADIEGFLVDNLREAFLTDGRPPVADAAIAKIDGTYKVMVVCDLSTAIAAGKYGYVNSSITYDDFPEPDCKSGQVDVSLVSMNRSSRTSEILAEMERQGLRPATLSELLALGAYYPDLQRQSWIMALGSWWRSPMGCGIFPALYGNGDKRYFVSDWIGQGDWSGEDRRFAAVRK